LTTFLPSDNALNDFANQAGSMAYCINNFWRAAALMLTPALGEKPPDV